jgi:energy-coupling factor transporter ATP-binding protein EcfA2
MTIVMSTHDLNLVASFADRVYVLSKGKGVVTVGTPAEIFLQAEALRTSNIDPPLLAELFLKLRERGVAVGMPAYVDQAVDDLVRLMKAR